MKSQYQSYTTGGGGGGGGCLEIVQVGGHQKLKSKFGTRCFLGFSGLPDSDNSDIFRTL